MHLYMYTNFCYIYTGIHTSSRNIHIHVYMLLRLYNYTSLHTSTPVYLRMFTYFDTRVPAHVYIPLPRISVQAYQHLHPLRIFICSNARIRVHICIFVHMYTLVYMFAFFTPIYVNVYNLNSRISAPVYILMHPYTCASLHTSTIIYILQ
jgi:hypothetical protein